MRARVRASCGSARMVKMKAAAGVGVMLRSRRATSRASSSLSSSSSSSSSQSCGDVPMGWRGDRLLHGSLPLTADGTPDYASIDASPISKVLTSTIRKLLVKEAGASNDDPRFAAADFEGVLAPVRAVNDAPGTARDVQLRARRVFEGILPALGIGWVIPIWKNAIRPVAPPWLSNFAFVLVFKTLFPWLMGPMEAVDKVDVATPSWAKKLLPSLPASFSVPQAIKAERCRFIESTGCASVCVNSCKVPSQEWLFEDFGMPMHIQPNYDDFSCKWEFGKVPPPLEEDEAVLVPCFSQCDSAFKGERDAVKQVMRREGETLEDIAARATPEAVADANVNAAQPTRDGSAVSTETLAARTSVVQGGGKCWSVSDERQDLREERNQA